MGRVIETYRQKDGSVVLPEVLAPYMAKRERSAKARSFVAKRHRAPRDVLGFFGLSSINVRSRLMCTSRVLVSPT